jgi:glycosyltransferase involved in cell wall biosynthesis
MGKAVVAPDFEPIKEVCQHGENILLFKPLNAKDFANSIIRLAKDPSLRKYLGNNLRRCISKDHTWRKNAERALEIYETIRKKK